MLAGSCETAPRHRRVRLAPAGRTDGLASSVSPAQRGAVAADGVARVPHRERGSHSRYRVTLEQPCSAQRLTKVGTVEAV